MNIIAIIQARYNSTRLPNKTMFKLKKKTILKHVLDRCKEINNVEQVCCAISDDKKSDIIAKEALNSKVKIFRGSERNVLKRYYDAANFMKADVILRVTSDCPLIDPLICEQVINNLLSKKADYSCNNLPPTWPHGLDCEAFSFKWLKKAYQSAKKPFDLEHVTPFIRNNKNSKIVNLECFKGNFKKLRWTLDTVEDLKFFTTLFSYMNKNDLSWEYPLSIINSYPEISNINLNSTDKNRL